MQRLFKAFNEAGIQYAVLHDWQSLPDAVRSDVDMVVDPGDLAAAERTLLRLDGVRVVQLIQYEATGFYFVVAFKGDEKWRLIPVDIATECKWSGTSYFHADRLLSERQRYNGLWVANPRVELEYLLTKKLVKGSVHAYQKARLQRLTEESGCEAKKICERLVGRARGTFLYASVSKGLWWTLEKNLTRLRLPLYLHSFKQAVLQPHRSWLPEVHRFWRRLRYPTGVMIVVLGPDGAGKSTLVNQIRERLARAFRRTDVFHLRPGILPRKPGVAPVTDPHAQRPYPRWLSTVKLVYLLLGYRLGYLLTVRPRLTRSTLVLFDRYYDDLLVDPRRYRYGGCRALAELGQRITPKPDLFFVLDVQEDVLLARKQELSLEEMRRQCGAYRRLAGDLPNAYVLDGSGPVDTVVRDATEIALDYMHRKYLDRRGLWFQDETLAWINSVIDGSPPSPDPSGQAEGSRAAADRYAWLRLRDGRGYLIPLRSRALSCQALRLYNDQSWYARVGKRLLEIGLRLGVAQRILSRTRLATGDGTFPNHVMEILGRRDLHFGVSMGTPGPHRKPVFQVMTDTSEIAAYVKLGWNEATNGQVLREALALERLATIRLRGFAVPRVVHKGWWKNRYFCVQSGPEGTPKPASTTLGTDYQDALGELTTVQARWMALSQSGYWKRICEQIEAVQHPFYQHVLKRAAETAEHLFGQTRLSFHLRHGDFTPWNAYRVNCRLYLFDWEYADPEGPPGWDLFHFVVQTMSLLQKRSPGQILTAFEQGGAVHTALAAFYRETGVATMMVRPLLLLYVVDRLAAHASETPSNLETLHRLALLAQALVAEGHPRG